MATTMTPRAGTVFVNVIRLDQPASVDLLDDDERRRAGRFMFERDRRRFVAAHTAMRAILGRYLQMDPAALRFEKCRPAPGGPANADGGKPRLVDPPIDLRFNLSHAGERALLAAALGREVGVDIEARRVISDPMHIATRFFSPAEQERLREASPSDVDDVFLRIWTRKESFIKARGDGLRFPLAGFEVSAADEGPQLLVSCEAEPSDLDRWTIVALPSEPGYLAALTVEGCDFAVVSEPPS
jgi:4'-phosphopantetheinyl transferase